MVFIRNISKEHNFSKIIGGVKSSCSLHIVRYLFIFVPSFMKISLTFF